MGFFQTLEDTCCSSLVRLFFPCHPSFSSVKVTDERSLETAEGVHLQEMPLDTRSQGGEEVKSVGGADEEYQREELTIAAPVSTTPGTIPTPGTGGLGGVENVGSPGPTISSAYSASGYHSTLDMMGHEGPEFKSVTSDFKSVVSVGVPGEISTADSQECYASAGEHLHPTGSAVRVPYQRHQKEHALLESMITNETPSGVLPRFSSWSFCRLGSSSGYNPAKGLEQPGFFPNSNFLLAWDIPLLNDSQSDLSSQFDGQGKLLGSKQMTEEAWPTLNELPSVGSSISALPLYQALSYARRQCMDYKGNTPPLVVSATSGKASSGASRQRGRPQREGAPTVRAYIGEEYECPRGHR